MSGLNLVKGVPLLRRRIAAALSGVRCPRWLYDWIWGDYYAHLDKTNQQLADARAALANAEDHEDVLETALEYARPLVAAWVEARGVSAAQARDALELIDVTTGGRLIGPGPVGKPGLTTIERAALENFAESTLGVYVRCRCGHRRAEHGSPNVPEFPSMCNHVDAEHVCACVEFVSEANRDG